MDTAVETFEKELSSDEAATPEGNANVADHDHDLTEDELSDLTFAFQACDLDDAGTIAPDELHAMLSVLGAEVDEARCAALVKEAKQDFKEWLATHDIGTLLPSYMEHEKGKGHGVHGETKHGGERHHAELAIDRQNRHHPVLSRVKRLHENKIVKTVATPVTYTGKLMSRSFGMGKDKKTVADTTEPLTKSGEDGVVVMEENALHGLQENEDELIFAEYVHMMCGDTIKKYTAADWHKSAYQMRLYRNAYDTADVDGDNALEFEELEMVVMALDPHHDLQHEDMLYLWQVLNPQGLKSLTFNDFLHGMKFVKADERCASWIDVNKPNKWEVLSLIIDTPVGEVEEQRILSSLTAIERAGINILANHTQPMDRARMGQVLKRAGDSRLRHLQQSQLDRMKQVHHRCVLLCGLVGFVWTIMPAVAENWLCWALEVDGVKDTYWVCRPHTIPANNTNSTKDYVPAWDPESTFMQHPELFMCSYRIDDESSCVYRDDYYGPHAGDLDWETVDMQIRCSMCACQACQCIPVDDAGEPDHNVMAVWWTILVVVIVVNIVFEIGLLMYIAVRYCVQVAWALDYRLIPLNADRAFVADSLVRAAFELGNPDSPVLGVDPHKETSSSSKLRVVFMLLMYKLKVVGTGLVVKAINKKITPAWFSLFANPVRRIRAMNSLYLGYWLTCRAPSHVACCCSVAWDSRQHCVLGCLDRTCYCAPSRNPRHWCVHVRGVVQRNSRSSFRKLEGHQLSGSDPDRPCCWCGYC